MNLKIRKLMLYKTLHTRNDIDKQYVSRKEVESELICIKDCVDVANQRLEEYIKKIKERLIIAANKTHIETINS